MSKLLNFVELTTPSIGNPLNEPLLIKMGGEYYWFTSYESVPGLIDGVRLNTFKATDGCPTTISQDISHPCFEVIDLVSLEQIYKALGPKCNLSASIYFSKLLGHCEDKVLTGTIQTIKKYMSACIITFVDIKFQQSKIFFNDNDLKFVEIIKDQALVTNKHFPHNCPKCNSPAYVGAYQIDCSRGCK